MRVRAFLPDEQSLELEDLEHDEAHQRVLIRVRSVANSCTCPKCGRSSQRTHSRYLRKLTDLPWQGLRVHLVWSTRRFFCDADECLQKIFTERLPAVAAPHSRRTERLTLAIRCIGFACGGEIGTRLADRLGIGVSADSLLREIRKSRISHEGHPRAVGVDDWAYRKGQRYGTLICDLETGRALDLLPDRDVDSLAKWLQGHSSIEIISRDRGDIYRKGATTGAPHALQVADRFHLMKNLRDAFGRFLEGQSKAIRNATQQLQSVITDDPEQNPQAFQKTTTTNRQARRAVNRERREALYDQAIQLRKQGISARSIAKQLGVHRSTVRKYLQAGGFPERASREYASQTDPFKDYLWNRWQTGCCNATLLWKEIVASGFKGSYPSVRRLVARWRKAQPMAGKTRSVPKRVPSPTQVSWLLFKRESKLSEEEIALKNTVLKHCSEIRSAWQLARRFVVMLRKRKGRFLDRWFEKATHCDAPTPIRQFAEGLRNDWEAVVAALSLNWN
ncbi:MAG: ISL3 family transposase, partial [Parvibaculaceae bacterium]